MEIIEGLCLGEVYSISNGGSRIFQTEDNDPRDANLLFNQFSPKLHENERKWPRGAAIFPVQFLKRFCCRLVEILATQFYLNI